MATFNIKSAYDNAWSPEFFGCNTFDSKLTKAIKDFQKANNLTVDGLCGKKTVAILKKNGAYPINDGQKKMLLRNCQPIMMIGNHVYSLTIGMLH